MICVSFVTGCKATTKVGTTFDHSRALVRTTEQMVNLGGLGALRAKDEGQVRLGYGSSTLP